MTHAVLERQAAVAAAAANAVAVAAKRKTRRTITKRDAAGEVLEVLEEEL